MPTFPTKEADILALTYQMIAGYKAHPADYPGIIWQILHIKRIIYEGRRHAHVNARSKAILATESKQVRLDELKRIMKNYLRKSEVDVAGDPAKLAYIGWGPKAASQDITMPGQPQNLRIINGENKLLLKWDRPIGGGTVRYYIIEKREVKPDSVWTLVATSYDTQKSLSHQPHGAQIEYRVKAVKTAGESIPGNIVSISL